MKQSQNLIFPTILVFLFFLVFIIMSCENDEFDNLTATKTEIYEVNDSTKINLSDEVFDSIQISLSRIQQNDGSIRKAPTNINEEDLQFVNKFSSGNLSISKFAISLDGDFIWNTGEHIIMAIIIQSIGQDYTDLVLVESNKLQDSDDILLNPRVDLEITGDDSHYNHPFWDIPIIIGNTVTVKIIIYTAPDLVGHIGSLSSKTTLVHNTQKNNEQIDDQAGPTVAIRK